MTTEQEFKIWLDEVQAGKLSWVQLAERLLAACHPPRQHQPDEDRGRRCRFGEVIFGQNKTVEAIHSIAHALLRSSQTEVLVTRIEPQLVSQLFRHFPYVRYDCLGKTLRLSEQQWPQDFSIKATPEDAQGNEEQKVRLVGVVTAGSTDLAVARESIETLNWMHVPSVLITDVGVAGPYRILPYIEQLRKCSAVIVVAGMEGGSG